MNPSNWKERDLAGELSTQNACCMASELFSAPPSWEFSAHHFCHIPGQIANAAQLAFKAKKVAFRERNRAKVEKSTFLHSSVAKKPARFFRFFTFSIPKPCANSDANLGFALRDFFNTWKNFNMARFTTAMHVS